MGSFILLFFSAFLPGWVGILTTKWNIKDFKLVLVFAGSYLFSITILHILPELFANRESAYFMVCIYCSDFYSNRYWCLCLRV